MNAPSPYPISAGAVKWWNLTTHRQTASFDWQHLGSELAVAFSPDGRLFAAGGDRGAMILVDVVSRAQRLIARAHLTRITALVFTPDGQRRLRSERNGRRKLPSDNGVVSPWV